MDHNLWIGFEPKPTWLKDNQIRILVRKGCQDSSDLIDRTLRSWTVRIQLWVHTRWTIGYLIWRKIVGTSYLLADYSMTVVVVCIRPFQHFKILWAFHIFETNGYKSGRNLRLRGSFLKYTECGFTTQQIEWYVVYYIYYVQPFILLLALTANE